MARLTNEQIRNMSFCEAENHATEHPAEALRVGKVAYNTMKFCGKKSLEYHGNKVISSLYPNTVRGFLLDE